MGERIPGGYAGVYSVLSVYEEAGRARRGYFVEGLGAAQFAAEGAVDRLRSLAASVDPGETRAHHDTADFAADAEDVHKLMGVPREYRPGTKPARNDPERTGALVLAATDPANAYGAALPRPARPVGEDGAPITGHKPGRKAGALVVLVDGELILYVERGGRTLLSWSDDSELLQPAVDALALTVRDGWLGS